MHVVGLVEAEKHKWIESEKAGHDLGEWAIRCWVREHWNGFLRDRWLEHLQGRDYWIELEQSDFGLLQQKFQDSNFLDEITFRLRNGSENLDILCWAIEDSLPVEEIIDILYAFDINGKRIECQLLDRLSHS
ncbi:MAG: hypothetical protein ABI353_18245 [Isosphaeraceae bacterium]